MNNGDLRVEAVSDPDGLLRLRDHWRRLARLGPDLKLFSTFEWFHAWWSELSLGSAVRDRNALHILVAWREGRVAAIAPLVLHTGVRCGLTIRKIEFAGTAISDYQDFLLEENTPELVSAITRHLAASSDTWDIVELRHIREDSPTPRLLDQALRASGLIFRARRERECAYMPIRSDWRTYLGGQSRRTRKTFRNHLNRFKELESHGVRLRIVVLPQDDPSLLGRMVELENRKQVKGVPTLYMFRETEQFYRKVFEVFGPPGQLYVAVMERGDRLIAYELGFRDGASIVAHAKAYDPEFRRFSPGTLLIPAIYDFGFHSGFVEYDFGRGDEEYKQAFTKNFRNTVRYEIWNASASSRLRAQLYFTVRPGIYRLRSRLGLGYIPRWEL